MLNHLAHLIVYAVAVMIAARIVPGIRVRSFGGALIFALVFAVLDKLLFWVLLVFTLPAVLLSFGLFVFVINALIFWLADRLTDSIEVDGFGAALLGSFVTTVLNVALTWVIGLPT